MNTDAELGQRLVEQMAEALVFADREGIVRRWNAGAEALFGHPAADAVGCSLDLIVPERLRAAHWDGYRRAIAEGRTKYGRESLLTRTVHRDGTTLYVDMSFAVVTGGEGEILGAMAVLRDATERRQRERETQRRIAELEQRLGESAGGSG